MPTLRDRVRIIQRHLQVEADGIIGPITLSALERALAIQEKGSWSLSVSAQLVMFLIEEEVGSQSYYDKHLTHPYWPGGASGVTVGIGYDLGYHAPGSIEREWSGHLSIESTALLMRVAGMRGADAEAVLPSVRSATIPWEAAVRVFYERTLPHYAGLTRDAFPGLETYPPDAQGAVLSLVYNRGPALTGTNREGMALLALQVAAGEPLSALADTVEQMALLVKPSSGLAVRRRAEAKFIAAAGRHTEDVLRV